MKFPSLALLLVALALPATAFAHARLVSATPAANATAKSVRTITLNYSERLTPKLSTATLTMTGMPGMANHPDMKMAGVTSAIGPDGTSLVLTLARPLPAGSYRIDWVVAGADTHRVSGAHRFDIG